jgi:hypothetical protein
MPATASAGVARLIETAHRFGELQFRDKLLHTLFDPDMSEEVRGLGWCMPMNDFSQASEFPSWMTEYTQLSDEMVAARKKR